jgi:hypothetical protein
MLVVVAAGDAADIPAPAKSSMAIARIRELEYKCLTIEFPPQTMLARRRDWNDEGGVDLF